jgi:hypothetical protein
VCAAAALARAYGGGVGLMASFALFLGMLGAVGRAESTEARALLLVVAAMLHAIALFTAGRLGVF